MSTVKDVTYFSQLEQITWRNLFCLKSRLKNLKQNYLIKVLLRGRPE